MKRDHRGFSLTGTKIDRREISEAGRTEARGEVSAAGLTQDRGGFSLVELMIVIALMAILGSFMFYGLSLLTGQYARQCANDLSAALSKEKNYALTRSASVDCYMELTLESDGYRVRYYQPKNAVVTGDRDDRGDEDVFVQAEEEKIGRKNVSIECTFDDGAGGTLGSPQTFAEGDTLTVVYDRVSGAVKEAYLTGADPSPADAKCREITISHGRTYRISLHLGTGKHELERVD